MARRLVLLALIAALVAAPASRSSQRGRWDVVGVSFWDARHGVLQLERPCSLGLCTDVIEVTRDGGRTWAPRWEGETGDGPLVAMPGGRRALVGAVRTDDGGLTWRKGSQPEVYDASFGTPRDGWGNGPYGSRRPGLLESHDGGLTWRSMRLPSGCDDFDLRPALADSVRGWLLCAGQPGAGNQRKQLFETDNAGRTWRNLPSKLTGGAGYALDISFLADGVGWWAPLSVGGIFVTRDGGHTWRPDKVSRHATFGESVQLLADDTGYVLAFEPRKGVRLFFTSDGGAHWRVAHYWRGSLP